MQPVSRFFFHFSTGRLFTIGSSTLGEIFNPAQDCSDIVDQIPNAQDGFYWIVLPNAKKHKVGFASDITKMFLVRTAIFRILHFFTFRK